MDKYDLQDSCVIRGTTQWGAEDAARLSGCESVENMIDELYLQLTGEGFVAAVSNMSNMSNFGQGKVFANPEVDGGGEGEGGGGGGGGGEGEGETKTKNKASPPSPPSPPAPPPPNPSNPYEHGIFLTISEQKSQLKIEQNKSRQNPQAQASISDRLQLLSNGYKVWYRRTSSQSKKTKHEISKGGRTFTTVASAMSDMISNSNQNNSNQNKQTARGRGKSPVPAKAEEERIMTTLSVYIDGCGGKKGLLEGWSCKIVPRKQNTKKISGYYKDSDTFFFSPDGKKLRTKSDVARFFGLIEEAGAKGGVKAKKRNRSDIDESEKEEKEQVKEKGGKKKKK